MGYAHRDDNNPAAITAWESSEDTVVTGYSGFLNKIYGNVDVTNGTWSLLNRTGIVGNFASDELTLQLPVIAENANYPAKSIPLAIDGISSGHTDVVTVSREGLVDTMDASTWKGAAVVPTLTENYITSWAPQGVGDQEAQNDPDPEPAPGPDENASSQDKANSAALPATSDQMNLAAAGAPAVVAAALLVAIIASRTFKRRGRN